MLWIFFDIDDTLWDFSKNSILTLQKLYNEQKLLQELFSDYDEFDTVYHKRNSELWQLYHLGKIDSEYLQTERFRFPIKEAGYHSADIDKLALYFNNRYLEMLPSNKTIIPNAIETLKILSKKYLIGAISNGFNHVQYRKIYNSELNRYIQRMIISDEIGIQKPSRKIFDYALKETGAEADKTYMIGDNSEADIYGALNSGWKAIYFNPKYKKELPQNTRLITIRNLNELPHILM